ncbi:hypothetical protein HDU79_004618 [Rhizoclosmatium sp. JEL0117]|nr:hypothetical protein HDU79_004618 [Rhizoclosmatium sp. JEL0117]
MSSKQEYIAALETAAALLLSENGYAASAIRRLPPSQLREITAQLLCVRSPSSSFDVAKDAALFSAVDRVLGFEAAKAKTNQVAAASLAPVGDSQLVLWKGDITLLNADVVVNAANSALLGCFQPDHKCIDNVIHAHAGPALRNACAEIVKEKLGDEGLPVGQVVATPAFNLSATYVYHTVGPQIERGKLPTEIQKSQLVSCYLNSLDLALTLNKPDLSIAFPCISTGLYGFPSSLAAPLVIEAVKTWAATHPQAANWKIIFNTFLDKDYELYSKTLEQIFNAPVPRQIPAKSDNLATVKALIQNADYLIISAAAGLSASAGLDYTSEEVFKKHHAGMHKRGFRNMYQFIGFSDWEPKLQWGYYFQQTLTARFSWQQRATQPTYNLLKTLVANFESKIPHSTYVVTSNADGMFDQYGFDKSRIYTRQGDYSRIQCLSACRGDAVWDIKPYLEKGLQSFNPETYELTDSAGIPKCPHCGGSMMWNVRGGDWFLENEYLKQQVVYEAWKADVLRKVKGEGKKLVILEVGAGFNTPGVLRFPNEKLAQEVDGVSLVRVNRDHAEVPVLAEGVGLNIDATLLLEELLA